MEELGAHILHTSFLNYKDLYLHIKIGFWLRISGNQIFGIFIIFLIRIQQKYDKIIGNRRRGALPGASGVWGPLVYSRIQKPGF